MNSQILTLIGQGHHVCNLKWDGLQFKTDSSISELAIALKPSYMPGLTSPVSVITTLHYFTPPAGGERAYQKALVDLVTGERTAEKNFDTEERPNTVIENLRGRENTVSLDKTGFQYFHHAPKHTSFTNDEEIKAEYYPESIELIKKLTGATRVVIFDHSKSFSIYIYYVLTTQIVQSFASSCSRSEITIQCPSCPSTCRSILESFHLPCSPTSSTFGCP